jgi:hypothetical protein
MFLRVLATVSCAAWSFANLIPVTDTHFDQSPLVSNPTIVNGKLRYKANSNICEMPGVNQKSGYVTVGQNMSMVRCLQRIVYYHTSLPYPFFSIVVLVL